MVLTCLVEVADRLADPCEVAEVEAVLFGAQEAGCAHLDHLEGTV